MIFVDNQTDLEYYTPNPRWGCYADSVFEPRDILIQANGFTATGALTVVINVCDTAGDFQEVATSYFTWNFRSAVIAGQTYYYVNIRCDNFSPFMLSNKCFTLNVVLSEDGTQVFNKWTQKYLIVTESGAVLPTLKIDGVSTAPCLPASNPALCVSSANGFVKFAATFDCYDGFNNDIYSDGEVISSYGELFNFTRKSFLKAKLRPLPSPVQRIISINCRTQKTSYTPLYILSGNEVFPEWKMQEIEGMLLASHLYADDKEYQSEGGAVFEQFGRPFNCLYVYKMAMPLQGCFNWQSFGCVPNCSSLATYYLMPKAYERVYDDSMRLVASDAETLGIYFESIPGTKSARELPFAMPCPTETLMQVDSSGVLPKFLYLDQPIPSQRVFPKRLPMNTLDFTPLCNGITNNNQIPIPDITGEDDVEINVPVPDITGEDDVSANTYTLQVSAAAGWTLDPSYTSAASYAGQGTLNLSMSTTVYGEPYINNLIATITGDGLPSRDVAITDQDNGNMPPNSTLWIRTNGELYYSGPATNTAGNTYYVELFMIKYDL